MANSILDSDPSKFYTYVRSLRNKNPPIETLEAGDQVFRGEDVSDGFFFAMHKLKIPSVSTTNPSSNAKMIYETILSKCENATPIPMLSYTQTLSILKSLSPLVADIHSLTPTHFLAAGSIGVEHFKCILNMMIRNVNLATIADINSAWAILLHKGNGKPKNKANSWCCISSCPLFAKAMDSYIFSLHKAQWNAVSAPTQFMVDGSCHDLCSLLLTEMIIDSVKNKKKPIIISFVDTRAAFDSSRKEHIINEVFMANDSLPAQSILYIAKRLSSRLTYLNFNNVIMGPIHDERGVEQGGVWSSALFQLTTNKETITLNQTNYRVNIHGESIASLTLANDKSICTDDK